VDLKRGGQLQDQNRTEGRRYPRVPLEVGVDIYSQQVGIVPGRTLDISESGISALVSIELPIGEVVSLEIDLPLGRLSVGAVVRNKNIFRHGFEFVEPDIGRELIKKVRDQIMGGEV